MLNAAIRVEGHLSLLFNAEMPRFGSTQNARNTLQTSSNVA